MKPVAMPSRSPHSAHRPSSSTGINVSPAAQAAATSLIGQAQRKLSMQIGRGMCGSSNMTIY